MWSRGRALLLLRSRSSSSSKIARVGFATLPVSLDAIVLPAASGAAPRHRLVVLHGLFGSNTNWRQLALQWNSRVRDAELHLLSARNHGLSAHADTMTYDAMCADLGAYLQALPSVPSTTVLGHSMGGKTAMLFALANPLLVNRLVVADIAPIVYPDFSLHVGYARAMRDLPLDSLRSRADIDRHLAVATPDRTTRAFLMTNLSRVNDSDRFRWLLNIDVLARDSVLEALRAWPADARLYEPFAGPTLFMCGGKSNYVSPASFDSARELHFPSAQLATIQNAGHWVHAEQPAQVVDAVINFAFS